jgi:2-polyprenyl-3-methyl-5-hydroxy-6-metoxy-1,4-benzoquinol methylase
MAYMRMAKVLFLQRLIDEAGISLEHKRIFDYGFGAGTFFHVCPHSATLAGVELDPVAVQEVAASVLAAGFKHVDLQPLEIERWSEHPLLQDRQYDVIVCSHVLEHLPDPISYLRKMRDCLAPGGAFLALVPINERKPDPHHQLVVTRSVVDEWARESGFAIALYAEDDPWIYWSQPLLRFSRGSSTSSPRASAWRLVFPRRCWDTRDGSASAAPVRAVTGSRPMQAGFVLRPAA